ncbi:MAG: TrgA family protein [Pseudooceanicola nanhaiensis]|jgi:hypothetical protein|uniref:TrgA family protein n=1 Tax=Pseudooceanicola nanhaiensis TaxID=375761 RepID=UPI00405A1969
MMTMPKVVAGALTAFLAWIVSGLVKTELLAVYGSYNFGWFVTLSVVVGFVCGYRVLGSRATGALGAAIAMSVGMTAAAATVFWVLALVTANEMLRLALERRYRGPVEGIEDMVRIGGNYGQHLLHANIILTLVIGGCIAGLLTEIAARRWN